LEVFSIGSGIGKFSVSFENTENEKMYFLPFLSNEQSIRTKKRKHQSLADFFGYLNNIAH